jgi:hypothetical protein
MSGCRRTAGILDAWLDTRQLDDRDARHLAGCAHCTAAFARVHVADGAIGAAVRSLVLEAAAVGVEPTAHGLPTSRPRTPTVRYGLGLASLAAVVVLMVVAGIRLSTAPAGPPAPFLPVPVAPAEAALHQSGLRCTGIAAGLECTRRLADGWRQVARLEVAGGAVRDLEVRLEPGTGPYPVADVAAALAEPATDVVGVDVGDAVGEAIACGCTRPIDGGTLRVDGDPVIGYLLTVETGETSP